MKNLTGIIGIAALVVGIVIGHVLTIALSEESNRSNVDESVQTNSPTRVYAEAIIIPSINFEEVLILDAVDYLRAITRKGREIEGVPNSYHPNFVVSDPDHLAKPISLNLRDIRLDQLCERIAEVSGMSVVFDEDAIVFQTKK